jgi:hypothetical protein
VIAVWIPVTVVPTSLATVAIDTFITELSSVIRNWPAASVKSTIPVAPDLPSVLSATAANYQPATRPPSTRDLGALGSVAQSVERDRENVVDLPGVAGWDLRDPADHLYDFGEVGVGAHDTSLLSPLE